ncbi:MAG: hypothetical protein R3B48_11035 [Kofleriaceae bacterium]
MCLSKKQKRTWQRTTQRALVVGAITVTTFGGGPRLRSESLAGGAHARSWRDSALVRDALDAAANPCLSRGLPTGMGGARLRLVALERGSR